MGYLIVLFLMLIVFAIGAITFKVSNLDETKFFAAVAMGAAAFIIVIGTIFASYTRVETGRVGVVYTFGNIQNEPLVPGLHWIKPWQNVKMANIQIQPATFEDLGSFTSEAQEVGVTETLNYQLSSDNVVNLYTEVGPDWYNTLIPPRVLQTTKEVTAKYSATALGPNRNKLRNEILEGLNAKLKPYSINVVEVTIDNIRYSDAFTNSIEAKQQATQQALQAEAKVRQSEAEAEQRVAEARGQAKANQILAASLTNEVIRSREIDNQAKMIEKLDKLNSQAQVIYVPNDLLGIGVNPAPASVAKAP